MERDKHMPIIYRFSKEFEILLEDITYGTEAVVVNWRRREVV
jgi:hypothetical protein